MAGAGYKLFNTGDVLLASEVNTYLMQQTVMVFADATARTTALSGVLAEGMVSYLQDTNVVEIYNGSAWASLDDPNAIQNTIVDAKGDLISATADNTPARLASSGNNGDVLTIDTSTSTGLKWAAAAGGGKVLQVVQATYDTQTTISSTSATDTGLTLSITPSANTSKVLIMVYQPWRMALSTNNRRLAFGKLLRGATSIISPTFDAAFGEIRAGLGDSSLVDLGAFWTFTYLDSPATTSSTTYKTQAYLSDASGATLYMQSGTSQSAMILLEIGA